MNDLEKIYLGEKVGKDVMESTEDRVKERKSPAKFSEPYQILTFDT
jgi:hypothetical protein